MPDPIDLGFAVKLPPRRAIAYFKAKGYAVSWNWWEVWQEAHAKAFTVAKATRLDVLHTLRGALQRALGEGLTERQFARDMEPALKKLGWWGRQVVVNESGEAELVQLGSPHRLKTIFRTNMNTSYAAARFRQQLETADSRPYWQYLAMGDARTRPSHAALNGQVFRHDDPFWNSHYPPNGFNCRCRVRALTAEQLKDRNLKITSSRGRLRAVNQPAGIDKRTGEVITRQGTAYSFRGPNGQRHVLLPDAGWSHNPGRDFPLFDPLGQVPDSLARLAKDQQTFRDFALPGLAATPAALRLPVPQLLDKADNAAAALAQLTIALALPKSGWRRVETPAGLDDVVIARSFLPHIVNDRRAARERYANYVLPTLMDPLEVWLTQYQDGSFRRRFIAIFEDIRGPQSYVIARENRDGSFFFNFMPVSILKKKYLDSRRQGLLLYRKQRGAGDDDGT